MWFTFVCLFAIIWVGWACYLVGSKSEVRPVDYLLAVLAWCMAFLPVAFKVSFGG